MTERHGGERPSTSTPYKTGTTKKGKRRLTLTTNYLRGQTVQQCEMTAVLALEAALILTLPLVTALCLRLLARVVLIIKEKILIFLLLIFLLYWYGRRDRGVNVQVTRTADQIWNGESEVVTVILIKRLAKSHVQHIIILKPLVIMPNIKK